MLHLRPTAARPGQRDARILIVDDEPLNVAVLCKVLTRAGYTQIASTSDPAEAVDRFVAVRPDLVCLDLHMPGLDGFAILERLAPLIPRESYLPILMLTGDGSVATKRRALSLGARDFLLKPFDSEEALLRIRNLLEPRFMHLELARQNDVLEIRVRERTEALEASRLEVLDRLARAAEYRDDATGEHTRRVGRAAEALARAIGLPPDQVDLIARAAPLHDLGKIGIPDEVLRKRGPLSGEEHELIKSHTRIGSDLLAGGRTPLVRLAERIALSHHERWDGTGYPERLSGETIPLGARIVAVVDVFDALSHPRVYRAALPLDQVAATLRAERGTHFDPRLLDAFLRLPHQEFL